MDFSIRHAIAGRLRLHVPALYQRSSFTDALIAWLRNQVGIKSARINHYCASLVIEYDRQKSTTLTTLLFHLRYASIDQVRAIVSPPDPVRADTAFVSTREILDVGRTASTSRLPLLLPTVSLALALSAHPLAIALNVPMMIWNGLPLIKRAWGVWSRERRLNVDFLDVLAVAGSIGQGRLLAGAIIAWLVRLGDWIRDLTAAGSKRAISELLEYQAKTAWVVQDGQVSSIPVSRLVAGDTVVIYPGEMIPVDGEILSGQALIDQQTITGESLPVERGLGETVFAATVIRGGQITVRAIRVGSQTIAGQIAELVNSAPVGDTRMQNHAERLADRLVLPTLVAATGAAVLASDIDRFLSLVIIDYGTGIRVAAPISVLSSMTQAARAGIIIKSGRHMERLAEVDTVVFDKTGTLTCGVPVVLDSVSYQRGMSPDHILGLAAAAEAGLGHPVADALRAKAREATVEIHSCNETRFSVGLGVEGPVDGYYLHVGSERFLRQSDIRVDRASADRAAVDSLGFSCLYVAVDGILAGLIPYADQVRPESRSVIQTLHGMGIRNTIMLTGDNAVVARAVAAQLGLTRQYAEMLPAEKAEIIRELRRDGHVVAMVGDGLNDSPALSYADVGIAMKYGTEVTQESAHVVLMEDSLSKLIKAIDISRHAVRLIWQNYAIVAAMNTMGLALALPGGLVSPVVTAAISNGSAVLASLNGMRPLLQRR